MSSVTERYGAAIPNITLVCRKQLPKNQREEIMTYNQVKVENTQDLIE